MNLALLALIGFALWTLLLVLVGVVPWRVKEVLSGHRAANEFSAGGENGPAWYQRLIRAHLNCLENLPVFATLVLVGNAIGADDGRFGYLALAVLGGRMGQSLVHLASPSAAAVNIRFAFYLLQAGLMLAMFWRLLNLFFV